MSKLKTSMKIATALLFPWYVIRRQNRVIENLKDKVSRLTDVLSNPTLTGLEVANKQLELGLQGPMCEHMAAVLGGLVSGCEGVENYLELRFKTRQGFFTVIITKPGGGLTPHQLRLRAEEECSRLSHRVSELESSQVREAQHEWYP